MTPNLMTMMFAGGAGNSAGFGAAGMGIGAGGIHGSSSLGASFGGVNASIGASASVNFSSALLQQLVNPQGQTVTPAQLERFRAELPADIRGQLDALLNQLAIQGGVTSEDGQQLPVPSLSQAQVNAQDVASNNVTAASLSPVTQESVLALLQDAINAQPAVPNAGQEEEEYTLLDKLLARTAPEVERPVSFATVNAQALPTDDAQSLWLNEVNSAAAQELTESHSQSVAYTASATSTAEAVKAPVTATVVAPLTHEASAKLKPLSSETSLHDQARSSSDVTLTQQELSAANTDHQTFLHGKNVGQGEGIEEAVLLKGNVASEALPQQVNQPVTPQPITSGFESLTFINELGVEHVQRPASSDNMSHFSAEFTRTPTFQSPTDQVAMQIRQQAHLGMQQIQLQLEPADLGRVEVQLEIASDGKVNAMVQADNQDTLDLLQRDSKALQDALADAGLQMNDESMQFSLNQQNDGYGKHEQGSELASTLQDEPKDIATPEDVIAHYSVNLQQGLDIRV